MSSNGVVISGAGLWKPEHTVTNEELVESYNAWAQRYNEQHAETIAAGEEEEKPLSSAEFVEKASGIRQRYAYIKDGILDVERMRPRIPVRPDEELSHQAEIAVNAAKLALEGAGRIGGDVDMVIVSCAYTQRSYPAIAIEAQHALGIEGFGFDMLVACSAATFALQRAVDAIAAGSAKCVLVINPELTSPQVNYTDRDSHFIFGDVSTAIVLEREEDASAEHVYKVLGSRAVTLYSNNIRSNFGYVSYADDSDPYGTDKLFHQNGRKVFKEVCPMAAEHLAGQIADLQLAVTDVKRWWLHQANLNMNQLITRRLIGRDMTQEEAPIVLDEYANTASAGSIIAFCLYNKDLQAGDVGVICSFGAGYSIGSLVIQKL
ncbi:MAG: beta-ketoacyl-ACP synthase III [Pseudomonadales bacterium]|jgi:beta-ketodecanoyl-[acyl-carrier-protein] synthase|nr:beta-ketoacyl-ACP synthase III [Pseudomonadales bacterium]MDP6469569.1 beta-ketoacyl-ACP synthase III [Pseudomonadales bacterium]MDP6827410.1 beta-ketoacyl-ACP synthase III [Pseudomonadales bacterium]MDP6971233.1 beta-ketoacyl-ACP synthase III [Pseudomonadales bacterium]|tara:strand:- start:690 stop:1817 length:1128 start_codon:yes stop_codon:yes gene_type:complete